MRIWLSLREDRSWQTATFFVLHSGGPGPLRPFNPRPPGPQDFPPVAGGGGGGGRLNASHDRLLLVLEKERRRSKAGEKSFRNHIGHFLAQIKIEVTMGQNKKKSKNVFRR